MSEQPQEWTVCPVIESSGKEWVGLSYIRCGTRTWGSMNTEVAKALCKDIKAALATEQEQKRELMSALHTANNRLALHEQLP